MSGLMTVVVLLLVAIVLGLVAGAAIVVRALNVEIRRARRRRLPSRRPAVLVLAVRFVRTAWRSRCVTVRGTRTCREQLGADVSPDEIYACAVEGLRDEEGQMPSVGRLRSIDDLARSEITAPPRQMPEAS